MKKSIYKVTGWSLAISAAILFGIQKNNVQTLPTSIANGYVSNTEENGTMQQEGNGVEYSTSYADKGNSDNQSSIDANSTITTTISAPSNNSKVQDIALSEGMGILDNKRNDEPLNNYNSEINSQDALAKGGPNNEASSTNPQFNGPTANSVVGVSSSSTTSSSTPASVNNARVSAPTVVTAPPNPSGGSSGGSGSGDPFVPIDDYYGLIALIAISTVVGVFTIKKSRVV
jgi:hypothetical protein